MQSRLSDALARDLAAARFTGEGVRALVGAPAHDALARMIAQPARRAAEASPGTLATLIRTLWLGDALPEAAVAAALPQLGVQGALDLGVFERCGSLLAPRMVIRPYAYRDAAGSGEWWIASDLDELAGQHPLRPNHVLGVGGAARTLAALLPTLDRDAEPHPLALDLGTGCGVIALHLRRIAQRVVATDISERALEYTRLTAALNGVDGIETRLGSLYEPVEGMRFDLIASNPPFVITPRAAAVPEYEYRDGGFAGDALMEAVVRGLAPHLAVGGSARLLGNWEHGEESGLARVSSWATASGVDSWVFERESLDPVAYAQLWLRDGGTTAPDPAHDTLLTAWLDDFDARGVTAIGMGWVALRQSGLADPLQRAEALPQQVHLEYAGAHLAEAFDDAAWLAAIDDAGLLEEHLVVSSDVTEARHHLPGASGPRVIELRQGGALARTLSIDTALAALVGACDGELSIGQIIPAIASLLEVDERVLSDDMLPRVRELVLTGFLRRLPEPAME